VVGETVPWCPKYEEATITGEAGSEFIYSFPVRLYGVTEAKFYSELADSAVKFKKWSRFKVCFDGV